MNRKVVGLWALLGVAAPGCAAGPKPAPEPLASEAHRYDVAHEGRKSMAFGNYKVVDIRRKWKKQSAKAFFVKAVEESSQEFSFKMYRDADLSTVQCKRSSSGASVGNISVSDGEQMLCDIDGVPGGSPWKIVLAHRGSNDVTGRLMKSGVDISIAGGRPPSITTPRNYVLGDDVAAVDVGPKAETVWLAKHLDPETSYAVAATLSALMVYDDLR
ncbi:MAG: hypothetical protein AAF721_35730 [Myxococcota bacterium]